jgi:hypothetical protein
MNAIAKPTELNSEVAVLIYTCHSIPKGNYASKKFSLNSGSSNSVLSKPCKRYDGAASAAVG